MEIVQIVPRVLPAICGVGDYARLLAVAMREHGVRTRFIVTDPDWYGENCLEGFLVEHLPRRDTLKMCALLEQAAESGRVLLHYVGYGYDVRGCPQWLLDALTAWRGTGTSKYLLTMFHELYATGKPWTRAFWSSRRQQQITAQIAQVSDVGRTNMHARALRLEEMAPLRKGQIRAVPVFSTVGETMRSLDWRRRKAQMVVFGSTGWRSDVYTHHRAALLVACRQLGIEQIVDIGRPLDEYIDLPVNVIQTGALPALEVSAWLCQSRAGCTSYLGSELGKSTIFAAYCAHGLLPIIVGSKSNNEDGLIPNVHYWIPGKLDAQAAAPEFEEIAAAAQIWYQQHRLEAQAEEVVRQFCTAN